MKVLAVILAALLVATFVVTGAVLVYGGHWFIGACVIALGFTVEITVSDGEKS